jgi:CRP/FNR family transcriptional regulator, cyclic AMP receptor protein
MDVDRLRQVEVFNSLTDEQLEWMALKTMEMTVPTGTHLVKDGDFAYRLFGILEGSAAVSRQGEHLATLSTGQAFGEMSLADDARRNADVVALSPMRLATLMSWDFREALKRFPELKAAIDQLVAERHP